MDVIFDLDGTLIDSAPAILQSFAQVLERHDITPLHPLSSALIGPPLRPTLQKLSGITDPARLEALAADFVDVYDGHAYRATLAYDGVDAMLRALLEGGARLHIATNKRLAPTEKILHHLGWHTLFHSVYALDRASPAYPGKADMLQALLRDEGVAVEAACYVGDTPGDLDAAQACGLRFHGVEWGYGRFVSSGGSLLLHERPEGLLAELEIPAG